MHDLVTHAYAHWLAEVQLAGSSPALTSSFHDSECSRKPPNAHSLGRYLQANKKKEKTEHFYILNTTLEKYN
ncbi:MAG: hypothetical protein WCG08_11160 [Paludibacter sp.]